MKKGNMICAAMLILFISCSDNPVADLVLKNGQGYTLEEKQPWASAVIIKGNKIVAVLDRNIIKNDPADVLNMQVTMTIVDGRIVFSQISQ